MKNILSTRSIVILFITIITTLTFAACSKGDKEQGKGAEHKNYKATEITVLLPSEIPADMLAEFEDETGIRVNLETSSWNNIQDKIVSALAAGVAPADVTEFDWSWIGQFGSAEWYTPLNESFDQEFLYSFLSSV